MKTPLIFHCTYILIILEQCRLHQWLVIKAVSDKIIQIQPFVLPVDSQIIRNEFYCLKIRISSSNLIIIYILTHIIHI